MRKSILFVIALFAILLTGCQIREGYKDLDSTVPTWAKPYIDSKYCTIKFIFNNIGLSSVSIDFTSWQVADLHFYGQVKLINSEGIEIFKDGEVVNLTKTGDQVLEGSYLVKVAKATASLTLGKWANSSVYYRLELVKPISTPPAK